MTAYERQIKQTEAYHDAQIPMAEHEELEVLQFKVVGSRLHDILHNPVDEGIDEG